MRGWGFNLKELNTFLKYQGVKMTPVVGHKHGGLHNGARHLITIDECRKLPPDFDLPRNVIRLSDGMTLT